MNNNPIKKIKYNQTQTVQSRWKEFTSDQQFCVHGSESGPQSWEGTRVSYTSWRSLNARFSSSSSRLSKPAPQKCSSSVFGVDFLVEEVLRQQVELPVLLPDSMRSDELELLQSKLIEVVFHFPDGRLLQLGDGLLGGRLLLARPPQVRFLAWKRRGETFTIKSTDLLHFKP